MNPLVSDGAIENIVRGVLSAIRERHLPDTQLTCDDDVLVITNENEAGDGDSEPVVSKIGSLGTLTSVGLAIRVMRKADTLTVLREIGCLSGAAQIESEVTAPGYNWFVACFGEECRLGTFRRAEPDGFTSPTKSTPFQDWVTRQYSSGIQKVIQAQPDFARLHSRTVVVCCVALGSVLDELLPPEARAPLMADRSIDAACFPIAVAKVCAMLREIGARPSPKAFSQQEAEQTIGAIEMVAKSCPVDQVVMIASRGQQLAVSRIMWSLEETTKAAPVAKPVAKPVATPPVNAKGGSC